MSKFLGQLGGAIQRTFLPACLIFLLSPAVFFLALPETASAQIWVSSVITVSTDGKTESATCSTSALNPSSNQPSSAAAGYKLFLASCNVTTSTGASITSPQCPGGANGTPPNFQSGNPTGQCTITYQPQPNVTYTLTSTHALEFNLDPFGTQCGQYGYSACFSDPLGYYSMNPNSSVIWPPMPSYPTGAASIDINETCTMRGGICTPQNIPSTLQVSPGNFIGAPEYWYLAHTSAVMCSEMPTIADITPNTWIVGQSYNNVTITGTGFTTAANASASCPVSTVSITTPSGTVVALSNISVVSATQITANISIPASETSETATITVSGNPAATTTADILGCFIPTTGTTTFQGWDNADPVLGALPTVGMWEQTVSDAAGDIFSGYNIQEISPQPGVDTCWWPGSKYLPIETVTGSQWTVNADNTWGPDEVGLFPNLIAYYRAQKKAPCGATVYQQMQIQCADSNWYNYRNVNTLQGSFTNSTVTSVRAGGTATRRY